MSEKRVNNEALRAMAERMYVEEGMTAKAIANAIDVTEQTIGRWKKGIQGDISWDEKRNQYLSTPSTQRRFRFAYIGLTNFGRKSILL